MIDITLIALEQIAVNEIVGTGLFKEVRRRKIGAVPDVTGHYEANVSFIPVSASGNLRASAEFNIEATIRVTGRDVEGGQVFDEVRFRSDLCLERVMSSPLLAELFAQGTQTSWKRTIEPIKGATVVAESVSISTTLQSATGAVSIDGAVASTASAFGVPGSGIANAAISNPVVYPAALGRTELAPATITALFVGAAVTGQAMELRKESGITESQLIASAAGSIEFTDIEVGRYTLAIVDTLTNDTIFETNAIQVVSPP